MIFFTPPHDDDGDDDLYTTPDDDVQKSGLRQFPLIRLKSGWRGIITILTMGNTFRHNDHMSCVFCGSISFFSTTH